MSAPGASTVNETDGDAAPPASITTTATGPGLREAGTVTTMEVALQETTVAATVPNMTVPAPG